jgi:hypothetical protein
MRRVEALIVTLVAIKLAVWPKGPSTGASSKSCSARLFAAVTREYPHNLLFCLPPRLVFVSSQFAVVPPLP